MFNLESFTAAGLGNFSVIVPRYCNKHLKIADVELNIGRELVLASRLNFLTAHFKVWSRQWQSRAISGVLPQMNLAAIDIGSISLKFFCCQNGIYLSYGSLVDFFRISFDALTFREQNHPSFLSL